MDDSIRTLIVEDEPAMRRLLEQVVSEREHDLEAYDNAEEGLTAHWQRPFQVILLDLQLPGMDGLELCRRVRERDRGEDVIIIVVTGRGSLQDLEEVLRAGASDYLAKPVDPPLLTTRLTIAEHRIAERRRRRHAEQALERSQRDFRRMIEMSPDGILICRAERIVYVNPAMVRSLEFDSPGELTGRRLDDLLHVDEPSVLSRRATPEDPPPWETRFRSRHLEEVVLEVAPGPTIEFEGDSARLLVARDVSERKKMQARLLLTDRMASVGTLAAGIAHEINNPLAFVLANLDFMTEQLPVLTSAQAETVTEFREVMEATVRGAERVRQIVGDMRTFSRTDDEQFGLVDVRTVLESSVNMAIHELRHRAQIIREYRDVPPVKANAGRLGQVFLNLLVNAAHALPVGDVDAHEVRISTNVDSGGHVHVVVTDTGTGMPEDIARRVFDPFFTTKPVGVGTGLGLSICHGIITALGGEIFVDTAPNRGTKVTVLLPGADLEAVEKPASRLEA